MKELFELADHTLSGCECAIKKIHDKYGRPRPYYDKNKNIYWKYDENKMEHICVFKTVRMISAFRAIFVLFDNKYYQEVYVILRTIVESLNDISFLLENYQQGKLTQHQQRFIEQCFLDHFKNRENIMEGPKPRDVVPRRKVQAGSARFLSSVIDPTVAKTIADLEEDVYSGYTHGTAQCVLEFYGVNDGYFPEFSCNGIYNKVKMMSNLSQIFIYFHRFINKVSTVCALFGFTKESDNLRQNRIDIETLLLPIGLDFSNKKKGLLTTR